MLSSLSPHHAVGLAACHLPGGPLRVWIINHYAYMPQEPAAARHHALADSLLSEGHEVRVVACSFFHKGGTHRFGGRRHRPIEANVEGVPFCWIGATGYQRNGVRRAVNMAEFTGRAAGHLSGHLRRGERPDVVVGSTPHPWAALLGLRVARSAGARFVLEVRDVWPDTLEDLSGWPSGHPLFRAMRAANRRLYRGADAVITALPNTEALLRERGVRAPITWVGNGVRMPERPAPWRQERDEPGRALQVGFAGALNQTADLDTVLEAVATSRSQGFPTGLTVVGDGPERHRHEETTRRLGIREQVVFIGAVPRSAVVSSLAKCDVLVLPLKSLGVFRFGISPNKLMDYVATGRPIVLPANLPVAPASRHDGVTRTFVTYRSEDPHDLARALNELSSGGADRLKELGDRAFRYGRETHDYAALGRRFTAALEEAVDRG